MKKAAFIRVAVTVEGDDDPAHDFSKTALAAVNASVRLNPPDQYKGLKFSITRIYEDSTPPEEDPDATGEPAIVPAATSAGATETGGAFDTSASTRSSGGQARANAKKK